ncbi:DUF1285 domain-containing protein [Halovulum sp. GXIMD14793]
MTKNTPDQNSVMPDAGALAAAAKQASARGPAPVHLWNPPFCGDLDMRITRDGTWFYQGTPIGRAPMVRLFSTILKREGDKYFLVTPVEKVGITVDDAPFVAVDFDVTPDGLRFTTNVGDAVTASPDHPIRVAIAPKTGEPSPYILIRSNLEALIDRKSFYRLVELGEHRQQDNQSWFGITSNKTFFPMIPSDQLG